MDPFPGRPHRGVDGLPQLTRCLVMGVLKSSAVTRSEAMSLILGR